jgi:hypothetical protein
VVKIVKGPFPSSPMKDHQRAAVVLIDPGPSDRSQSKLSLIFVILSFSVYQIRKSLSATNYLSAI